MAARHRKAKERQRTRQRDAARQRANVKAAIAPAPRPAKSHGLRVSANPDKLTNPKRDSKYRRAANPAAAIPAAEFAKRYGANTVPAASIASRIPAHERARAEYMAGAYADTADIAPVGTRPDYCTGASIPHWIGASPADVDRDDRMHARDAAPMVPDDEREYPGETRYGYARVRDGETTKAPPTLPDGTYRHVHETAKNFEERKVAAPAGAQDEYTRTMEVIRTMEERRQVGALYPGQA